MARRFVRSVSTVGVLGAALVAPVVTAGAANAAGPAIAYVAPSAAASHAGTSCTDAVYRTIQSAVNAVRLGGMVVVCAGYYHESVSITKQITLQGLKNAIIDASGLPYGVGVGAAYTTVTGLVVQNAGGDNPDFPYDGIVTAVLGPEGPVPADHVVITNNLTRNNQGNGIDLNSTTSSVALNNISDSNGVGINVSDDLGAPARNNLVQGNVTDYNGGGCGIALADHSGLGVIGNLITGNTSDWNGFSTPSAPDASAGSGVILASPVPGGIVKNNVIQFNEFQGNGHGGVVVHSHVPSPANDFSGNRIYGNVIGTNNTRQDTSDPDTTGIYLGSATPLSITVADNVISNNVNGIFTAGQITVTGTNWYTNVTNPTKGVPSY